MISMPLSREYPMGLLEADNSSNGGQKGKYGIPLRHVMQVCTENWAQGYIDEAEKGEVEAMICVAQFYLRPEGWAGVIQQDISEGVRWCNKIEVFDPQNSMLPRIRSHFGIDQRGLVDAKANATSGARLGDETPPTSPRGNDNSSSAATSAAVAVRHETQVRELMTSSDEDPEEGRESGNDNSNAPTDEEVARVMNMFSSLTKMANNTIAQADAKS